MSTNNQYFDYFSVFKETFLTYLLKQGGYGCQISREDIIRESGVSPALVTRKIKIHNGRSWH